MEPSAGERNWTGYVVPALVTVLLGLHFYLGFRGFDRPDGGLLGLLEAPGALLGWGGVTILAVLLGWLIAGLVGRDLFGLQGASGLIVRLVGVVALGLALAGVCGLVGGRTAGGEVGAGIGGLLGGTLGEIPAILILLLMAIPALVLSISPFFTTGPKAGRPGEPVSRDALSELEPKPGLYEGTATHQTRPLYPERRFDEDGHEIPMSFESRDVGQVRYADEEPDPSQRVQVQKPDPVPVGAAPLPDGVRFADDEPEAEGPARPDAVDADDGRIPLGDGVRYADEESAAPAADPEEDPEGRLEGSEGPEDNPEPEPDEEAAEPEPAPEVEKPPAPPRPTPPSVPAVAPRPVPPSPAPEVKAADALEQLQDEDEGAHYRAKLEGSGIFDEPTPSAPPPEPEPEPAPPKKKVTKKNRPTKSAGPERSPKGEVEGAKRKPPKRKKKATPKKKTPKKKAPAKKKPPPDPEPEEVAPIEVPPPRKGTAASGPADEVYRKAVEVAMERSAASSVLLSRRLGIGYAQARALIELLVKDRILGEMTPSGSRPLLITQDEWDERTG